MESDEHFVFEFDAPLDLEAVHHDYVRPLCNLIELAAAEATATLELRVMPAGAEELTRGASVLSAIAHDPPDPRHWFQMLFRLEHVEFEELVPAWWRLHGEVGVVCDLLASLRDRGHVGAHFLSAASAIEAYHRRRHDKNASVMQKQRVGRILDAVPEGDRDWLRKKLAHSHEPSFAERVDQVVAKAGPRFAEAVGDARKWRSWVRNARDSVAHRGPKMIDVDKEWRTTIRVTATIQWLMALVLLRDLGIDDDVVATGLREERGFAAASDMLRLVKPEWFPK